MERIKSAAGDSSADFDRRYHVHNHDNGDWSVHRHFAVYAHEAGGGIEREPLRHLSSIDRRAGTNAS